MSDKAWLTSAWMCLSPSSIFTDADLKPTLLSPASQLSGKVCSKSDTLTLSHSTSVSLPLSFHITFYLLSVTAFMLHFLIVSLSVNIVLTFLRFLLSHHATTVRFQTLSSSFEGCFFGLLTIQFNLAFHAKIRITFFFLSFLNYHDQLWLRICSVVYCSLFSIVLSNSFTLA